MNEDDGADAANARVQKLSRKQVMDLILVKRTAFAGKIQGSVIAELSKDQIQQIDMKHLNKSQRQLLLNNVTIDKFTKEQLMQCTACLNETNLCRLFDYAINSQAREVSREVFGALDMSQIDKGVLQQAISGYINKAKLVEILSDKQKDSIKTLGLTIQGL